jgi:hypothetical protein
MVGRTIESSLLAAGLGCSSLAIGCSGGLSYVDSEPAFEHKEMLAVAGAPSITDRCEVMTGDGPSVVLRNGESIAGSAYAGVTDTTITKTAPKTNLSHDVLCRTKGGAHERACLLRFDLAPVPTDAVVEEACLALNIVDPTVREIDARQLLKPWSSQEATWRELATGSAWGKAGARARGDRGGADIATIASRTPSGPVLIRIDRSVVQRWIAEPSSNHGLTFAHANAFDGMSLSSSEALEQKLRPALLIKYR